MNMKKKLEIFYTVNPMLEAMFGEFKELSKKKPDGAVSKNKIKVVNRLIAKCKEMLNDEPSTEYLDLLDEDDVPQNSDVVLMLSQYVAAMYQFKRTHDDEEEDFF